MHQMISLAKHRLMVEAEYEKRVPLKFSLRWTVKMLDEFLRKQFPELFVYLDEHFPLKKDQYHWIPVMRDGKRQTLLVYPKDVLTGRDLSSCCTSQGGSWYKNKCRLYIGESTSLDVYTTRQ